MREVLLQPVITEKSSTQIGDGKYTFIVVSDAGKVEIQQAVKAKYGVDVEKVNTLKTKPKKRRRGRIVGMTSVQKKAVITLKQGQEIGEIKGMF